MEAKDLKALMMRVGVPVAEKMSAERMVKRIKRHAAQNEEVRQKMTPEERAEILGEDLLVVPPASVTVEPPAEKVLEDALPQEPPVVVKIDPPAQKRQTRIPVNQWVRAKKPGALEGFRQMLSKGAPISRKTLIDGLVQEFGCKPGTPAIYIWRAKKGTLPGMGTYVESEQRILSLKEE